MGGRLMSTDTARKPVAGVADMLLPADRRGRNVLAAAISYACTAHDADVTALRAQLAQQDTERLADLIVVLGAMVDVERTPAQLLAWMCPPGQDPRPARGTELCGTIEGHMLHVQTGEDPCRPCQAAFERETAPLRQLDKVSTCPSPGGYYRHKRAGEKVCSGCREAIRAYWRNDYQNRRRQPSVEERDMSAKCGTRPGYQRHKRAGEPICAACLAENRRYFRDWARKKRGKSRTRAQANAANIRVPCGEAGARRRHCRNRQRCDTCWPPDAGRFPSWYPPPPNERLTGNGRRFTRGDSAPVVSESTFDVTMNWIAEESAA